MSVFKNPNYKGSYPYMTARKAQYLAYTLALAFGVIAIFTAGLLIWHTKRNFLTIPAMLLVIPFANFFASWMAMALGSTELDAEKRAKVQKYEDAGMLFYHLMYCDEKGKRQFMDCVLFYQGGIVAYCHELKAERKTDVETDCITRFKKKALPYRLKIYTDWAEYEKRIADIDPVVPEEDAKKVERAMEQFLNLCL